MGPSVGLRPYKGGGEWAPAQDLGAVPRAVRPRGRAGRRGSRQGFSRRLNQPLSLARGTLARHREAKRRPSAQRKRSRCYGQTKAVYSRRRPVGRIYASPAVLNGPQVSAPRVLGLEAVIKTTGPCFLEAMSARAVGCFSPGPKALIRLYKKLPARVFIPGGLTTAGTACLRPSQPTASHGLLTLRLVPTSKRSDSSLCFSYVNRFFRKLDQEGKYLAVRAFTNAGRSCRP